MGLVFAVPVAHAHVLAVQPDLADLPVGQFAGGVHVDDDRPFVQPDLAAGNLRDGVGRVGRHLDESVVVELLPVDVNDRGRLRHRGAGHVQGGLGQTVGRFDRGITKPERPERVVELAHRRYRDRLAAVEDRLDVAQIQRRLTVFGHAPHRGVLEREIRCHRVDLAGIVVVDPGQLPQPPNRSAHERGRRHERVRQAQHRRQQNGDQTHVVEERQPGHPRSPSFPSNEFST